MTHLTSFFIDSYGQIQWISVAGVAFALIFLVVGIFRIVEFSGLGLTPAKKNMLSLLHIVGCFMLSGALMTISTDTTRTQRGLALSLLIAALILFAPGQVTIALFRRKQSHPAQ
jgi:peptidoglycan/LPS O-acetylase OafA/YrhL